MSKDVNEQQATNEHQQQKHSNKLGIYLASCFGLAGAALVAISTPFVLPALRKHCLPFVPATDQQLKNLRRAFEKHAMRGDNKFIDIGSGDGRICRLAHETKLFSQVHGVELNSLLVNYSRLVALRERHFYGIKYYRSDLWKFPLQDYDSICIFGVESMMNPLEEYLRVNNLKRQTIFACRFPFRNLKLVNQIGEGIDTVWVYELQQDSNKA